ncbi:MAG: DNA-binding protein [Proteobacteria bacterium]|nr:DNA-binding protein [Pseudomonadota bacterium]
MSAPILLNAEIADRLEEVAQILAGQNANSYRLAAYRSAAHTLRTWPEPVNELVRQHGLSGLMRLPGIGERLASAIYQLVTSGRLPMLDRLRGDADPVGMLASVPGIGTKTAQRIHERLGIDTLEELECAAHDGRLERLGVGAKRLAGVRDTLAGRLGRAGRRAPSELPSSPDIAELLDIDREYRAAAARGLLPRIAPRRFNPRHEAWLPVLHTGRAGREYTALFSNTARAHELARTGDWVVLYYDGSVGSDRQCTVITAQRGPLRGQRIVRGREDECLEYYAHARAPQTASAH